MAFRNAVLRSPESVSECTRRGIHLPFSVVSVKPGNIQLTLNDSSICHGDVFSLSCSADGGSRTEEVYQLFENDVLVSSSSSSSSPLVWSKSALIGGLFVYRCVVDNSVETANATITVPVNGKNTPFFFFSLQSSFLTLPYSIIFNNYSSSPNDL